jgi:dUTP pyrophosphatase
MNLEEQFFYYFALKSSDKPTQYNVYYLRGLFDTYGNIQKKTVFEEIPEIIILLEENPNFIECIKQINIKICDKLKIQKKICTLSGHDAFDFLSFIYDNSDPRCRNQYNYEVYKNWSGNEIPHVKFFKSFPEAILPSKERGTDVGYDLTIVKKIKEIGSKTNLFDTGIKVCPQFGYYTKIVPRSSLIKSGYMLTNSTGIIDGSYKGNLMICLTKIDDSLPDLILPYKCCQLIIDKSIHYTIEEVFDENLIGESTRGNGGFGSTDKV